LLARKNGFVTAAKLGTTNGYFVASTKNFAAATKRFVGRTKYFVAVATFVISILTNGIVGIRKPFFPCGFGNLIWSWKQNLFGYVNQMCMVEAKFTCCDQVLVCHYQNCWLPQRKFLVIINKVLGCSKPFSP